MQLCVVVETSYLCLWCCLPQSCDIKHSGRTGVVKRLLSCKVERSWLSPHVPSASIAIKTTPSNRSCGWITNENLVAHYFHLVLSPVVGDRFLVRSAMCWSRAAYISTCTFVQIELWLTACVMGILNERKGELHWNCTKRNQWSNISLWQYNGRKPSDSNANDYLYSV